MGSVKINSCSSRAPLRSAPLSMLKKFLMNVRAALGSEAGLNGNRRKGISSARCVISRSAYMAGDSQHRVGQPTSRLHLVRATP